MAKLSFDINEPSKIKIEGLEIGDAWSLRLIDANFMLSAYNGVATSTDTVIINVIWKNVNLQSYGYVELVVNGKHCHSTQIEFVGGQFLPFEREDEPEPTTEIDGELCVSPETVVLGKDVTSFKLSIISFCNNEYSYITNAADIGLTDNGDGGFYINDVPTEHKEYKLVVQGGCEDKDKCLTINDKGEKVPILDCDCENKTVTIIYDPDTSDVTDCTLFASNKSTTKTITIDDYTADVELTNGSWSVYSVEGTLELTTSKYKKNNKYYLSVALNDCEGGESVITIKPKDTDCKMLTLTVKADDRCVSDNYSFCIKSAYTQSACSECETNYGVCGWYYTYHVKNNLTDEETWYTANTKNNFYWDSEWDGYYIVSAETEDEKVIEIRKPLYTIYTKDKNGTERPYYFDEETQKWEDILRNGLSDGQVSYDHATRQNRYHAAVGRTACRWMNFAHITGRVLYSESGTTVEPVITYEQATPENICAEKYKNGVGILPCMNYGYEYIPSGEDNVLSACEGKQECFFDVVSAQTYFIESTTYQMKGNKKIGSDKSQEWSLFSNDPLMKYTVYGLVNGEITEVEKFKGTVGLTYTNSIDGLTNNDFIMEFKHEGEEAKCFNGQTLKSLPLYYIVPNKKSYTTLTNDYTGTIVFIQKDSLLELDLKIKHYKYCIKEEDKEFSVLDEDGNEICPLEASEHYTLDVYFLCDGSMVYPSDSPQEMRDDFTTLNAIEDEEEYSEKLGEFVEKYGASDTPQSKTFSINSLWGSEYVEYYTEVIGDDTTWINASVNESCYPDSMPKITCLDVSPNYNYSKEGREGTIVLTQQYSNASYIKLKEDSCEPELRDGKYIYVDGWRSTTEVTEQVTKEIHINVYQCKCPPPKCTIEFVSGAEELYIEDQLYGEFIYSSLQDAADNAMSGYTDDDYDDDNATYIANMVSNEGYDVNDYDYFVVLPKASSGYCTFTITSQTEFYLMDDASWLGISATTKSEELDYECTYVIDYAPNNNQMMIGEIAWQSTSTEDECSKLTKILFIQTPVVPKDYDVIYIEYALVDLMPVYQFFTCSFYNCDATTMAYSVKVQEGNTLTQQDVDTAKSKLTFQEGKEFNGWDKSTNVPITADTQFIAQCKDTCIVTSITLEEQIQEVSYTFKSCDGTVVLSGKTDYGTVMADLAAQAQAQIPNFESWDKDVNKPIVGNTTYNATCKVLCIIQDIDLSEEAVNVTYRFLNHDGSVAKSGTLPKGSIIPTDVVSDAENIVTSKLPTGMEFNGWDKPTNQPLLTNTDFTAQEKLKKVKFSFTYNNTTVLSGETDYGSDMSQYAISAQTEMEKIIPQGQGFDKWTPNVSTPITSDTVYTGSTTTNMVKYTFIYNGTQLSSGSVAYNTVMTPYANDAKSKMTIPQGKEFDKWDKDVTQPITADTVYTASVKDIMVKYTFMYNGSQISTGNVVYNTVMTSYANDAQSKITLPQGKEFDKWTPNVNVGITSDTTYTASVKATQVSYTFKSCDGTVVSSGKTDYGTVMTTLAAQAQAQIPNFESWDKNVTQPITADTTYNANCSIPCEILDINLV